MVHREKDIIEETSASPVVAVLSTLEKQLLNDYQRSFPLNSTPFAELSKHFNESEEHILEILSSFKSHGLISRVGPVFAPNRVGTSTLVAMAVPPESLDEIAEVVSSYPEVNHNYEREHRFNLWYVLTAPDQQHLQNTLEDIRRTTGLDAISLPMAEAYHIDLGFKLKWKHEDERLQQQQDRNDERHHALTDSVVTIGHDLSNSVSERLVAAVQGGLPLVSRPYQKIAEQIGISELDCIQRLQNWIDNGTISRMGVVVRHRELGYRANAMVVWDVADEQVSRIGNCFAKFDFINLCYQRPRHLPQWRYNLFCMIHGQDRKEVLERVEQLAAQCLDDKPVYEVLFSCRRFKQRGARYHIDKSACADRVVDKSLHTVNE
ncbi:MAG TPA: Lrp/AsnC family transcriptional regulator [Ectothiorhodospiraceae bacterium]|nr:Lrp/AsnC family transcriptional regulator [Ectothiorhodospiraceae bacterium]